MFDTSRVAIIDKVNSNIIIRGNCPKNKDNNFAFQEIIDFARFSPERFITLSLMDNVSERDNWKIDFDAYNQDTSIFPSYKWPPYLKISSWDPSISYGSKVSNLSGCLYWWPIEGMYSDDNAKEFLASPGWNFSGCVDLLCKLSLNSNKTLIYFHCMSGADRTGALHAGYLMKSKNMKAKDVLDVVGKSTATANLPSYPYIELVNCYGKTL